MFATENGILKQQNDLSWRKMFRTEQNFSAKSQNLLSEKQRMEMEWKSIKGHWPLLLICLSVLFVGPCPVLEHGPAVSRRCCLFLSLPPHHLQPICSACICHLDLHTLICHLLDVLNIHVWDCRPLLQKESLMIYFKTENFMVKVEAQDFQHDSCVNAI